MHLTDFKEANHVKQNPGCFNNFSGHNPTTWWTIIMPINTLYPPGRFPITVRAFCQPLVILWVLSSFCVAVPRTMITLMGVDDTMECSSWIWYQKLKTHLKICQASSDIKMCHFKVGAVPELTSYGCRFVNGIFQNCHRKKITGRFAINIHDMPCWRKKTKR